MRGEEDEEGELGGVVFGGYAVDLFRGCDSKEIERKLMPLSPDKSRSTKRVFYQQQLGD